MAVIGGGWLVILLNVAIFPDTLEFAYYTRALGHWLYPVQVYGIFILKALSQPFPLMFCSTV